MFQSFFIGGFECSSHRLRNGKRLDVIAATRHDEVAAQDYLRLAKQGIRTVRDGIRWPLIEQRAGYYDWSSVLPMVRAARETGTQVIWDLCHYGWPDDLDIFKPAFVERFARMAQAFAQLVADETEAIPYYCPINEISFLSWAGGDAAYLNPFERGRGYELKVQLVRAAIAAMEAIWQVAPAAQFIHVEPAIHVVTSPDRPWEHHAANGHRLAQYQAWDLLTGREWPQVGGDPKYLGTIGVNYYSNNQWIHGGPPIDRFHPHYRRFRHLLTETYERYRRPMFVAETGIEFEPRPEWLRYIASEVRAAMNAGVPMQGICLYPVVNHPGWDDERHCLNGLFDYCDETGERELYEPLAVELQQQSKLFSSFQVPPTQWCAPTQTLKNICLFTDSPEPSGLGQVMLTLATVLKGDYNLTFVGTGTPQGIELTEKMKKLGLKTLLLGDWGDDKSDETLRNWLITNEVQVFNTHAGIGWESHRSVRIARVAGVPAVVRTEHLPYLLTEGWQRDQHQRLLDQVDKLICVSEEARRTFIEAGLPQSKLAAVPNGVRPPPSSLASTAATRLKVRAALGLPPQAQVVLTVGRLTPQKDPYLLLNNIGPIVAQNDKTHFVWAGSGPLHGELRDHLNWHGLTKQVHLLGWRDDVADLLQAADIFVLPSRFEGLPLAVLEAMSVGLPVVGTRVAGTVECVQDGITGRLVEVGDGPGLATAICEVLEQPMLAAQWGAAGRSRFEKEFSASRMAQDTIHIFEELLRKVSK